MEDLRLKHNILGNSHKLIAKDRFLISIMQPHRLNKMVNLLIGEIMFFLIKVSGKKKTEIPNSKQT
jgi:hypothetical protein